MSVSDRILAWLLRGPQAGILIRKAINEGAAERYQATADRLLAEEVARIKARQG